MPRTCCLFSMRYVISGTTISTPSSSVSGNMRPASMTMMSSPQRTAMQFIPNSPRPPRGTRCSFPAGISNLNANRVSPWFESASRLGGCGGTGLHALKDKPSPFAQNGSRRPSVKRIEKIEEAGEPSIFERQQHGCSHYHQAHTANHQVIDGRMPGQHSFVFVELELRTLLIGVIVQQGKQHKYGRVAQAVNDEQRGNIG